MRETSSNKDCELCEVPCCLLLQPTGVQGSLMVRCAGAKDDDDNHGGMGWMVLMVLRTLAGSVPGALKASRNKLRSSEANFHCWSSSRTQQGKNHPQVQTAGLGYGPPAIFWDRTHTTWRQRKVFLVHTDASFCFSVQKLRKGANSVTIYLYLCANSVHQRCGFSDSNPCGLNQIHIFFT